MTTVAIFGSLVLLMLLRVPIAVALGLSSVLGLWLSDISLEIVAQRMLATNNSFPLLAIPFFILAGEIMSTGGMSRRLVGFASSLVSHLTGGLARWLSSVPASSPRCPVPMPRPWRRSAAS